MKFDVPAAIKAGHSPVEIATYLVRNYGLDTYSALQAGCALQRVSQ